MTTRPTTPAGAMTAMSAPTPSPVPLSIVSVRKSGRRAGRDDLGGGGLQIRPIAKVEQLLEGAAAIGERALLLQRRPAPPRADGASSSFVRLHVPQPDVAAPHAAHRRRSRRNAALDFGEHAEGHRLEDRHAACANSPARKSAGCDPASRRGTGNRPVGGYPGAPRHTRSSQPRRHEEHEALFKSLRMLRAFVTSWFTALLID